MLTKLGFSALATTSAGFAGSLGRRDGRVTRAEALQHSQSLVRASDLPISADLENGFAHEPEGVAETLRGAFEAGLAGCSIEDFSNQPDGSIYELGLAVERVAAAAEEARRPGRRIVLTARAENHLRGRPDLDDTIARLRAFEQAGADVLYAPGIRDKTEIAEIVRAVEAPVNVLLLPGGPNVAELAELGVARISVGGAFHLVAMATLETAGRELLEQGTHGFWAQALAGSKITRQAFD